MFRTTPFARTFDDAKELKEGEFVDGQGIKLARVAETETKGKYWHILLLPLRAMEESAEDRRSRAFPRGLAHAARTVTLGA